MSGLTDAAKAEIRAAIEIIRKDKVHGYIRKSTGAGNPNPPTPPTPPVPPTEPPANPPTGGPGGPTPPPPKPPESTPPTPPKPRSAWWGEVMTD